MRTGVEQTRSQKEKAQREESKGAESPPPDAPKPKELPKDAESCIQDAETHAHYGSRVAADADWVAMKAIVAGVRREGSWKAYCRVEHKRFLRLRSLLVRGRAKTTDARVDRILRLPNGACWNVLAYWREAA